MQGAWTLPWDRGTQPRKADGTSRLSEHLLPSSHADVPSIVPGVSAASPSLVRIYNAELQQVLDVLAREAQGLPDARTSEGTVLDEPVHRRGARLGRTLRTWKDAHLLYFDTARASNAPHRSHQRTLSN